MEIHDLHDGTFKTAHEMWATLKKRAKLGRNEWHTRASKHTRRILSSPNNLSAVIKGKRKMPLHDIVPMLQALALEPDVLNHYVREFLKSYLPSELVGFFHAPDNSTESLLLREANQNLYHAMNTARTEISNAILMASAQEKERFDPNFFADYATGEAEKAFIERRKHWISLSTAYIRLSIENDKTRLAFLNDYMNIIVPANWRSSLYTEVNNDVLSLIQFDAPSTQMSWLEHCMHMRPLRAVLPILFERWRDENPTCADRFIEAWRSIPKKLISRHTAHEHKVWKFIEEYFKSQSSTRDFNHGESTFRSYVESYLLKLFDCHPDPINPINPLHDFYGTSVMELKLIGEFIHYEKMCSNTSLSFEGFTSFGAPPAVKSNKLLRDMSLIIIRGLLRLNEPSLKQPLIKAGMKPEDFRYFKKALQDATLLKQRVAVLKSNIDYSEYYTIERLIIMLPKALRSKYRLKAKKCVDEVITCTRDQESLITSMNKLASGLIEENIATFLNTINMQKLNDSRYR